MTIYPVLKLVIVLFCTILVPSSHVLSLPVVYCFFSPSVIVAIIMWLMCHLCVLLQIIS